MNWLKALAAWELFWWVHRLQNRQRLYAQARAIADSIGKPLVVIGAPDSGPTSGYGCGDVTIDIAPSSCPNSMQADITKRLPFADNSCVVVVMCVLDYVDDLQAALTELRRIAGPNLFVVRVEPWTLVAHGIGYAPIKHALPCDGQDCAK